MTDPPTGSASRTLPSDIETRWYNSEQFDPGNPWAEFVPTTTAVVLVDMINWQAHRDGTSIAALRAGGADAQADYMLTRCENLVMPRLRTVLAAARQTGVRVVHVRLASRSADYGDVVPAFQPYMRGAKAADGDWATEPLDGLWAEGDVSVVKRGSGAFSSDLDAVLRERGIRTLVYAGVLTSACVLVSVASGFDLGYRQYVISECTAALSDEEQSAAERLISTYLAQIVSAKSAVAAFRSPVQQQ